MAPSSPSGHRAAIVTNVEPDHLEHWGGEEGLRAAFVRFVAALPGPAVLCLDDAGAAALVAHARTPLTYGTDPAADYVVEAVEAAGTGVAFDLVHGGERVTVELAGAPGLHNARNAAGALALAHQMGVGLPDGVAALAGFRGVDRRFEVRGEAGGVLFVDSYDHLPAEVSAALRPRARARGGASCAASNPTGTAAPKRSGRASRTPSRAPTCSRSPTCTRRARRRAPG